MLMGMLWAGGRLAGGQNQGGGRLAGRQNQRTDCQTTVVKPSGNREPGAQWSLS